MRRPGGREVVDGCLKRRSTATDAPVYYRTATCLPCRRRCSRRRLSPVFGLRGSDVDCLKSQTQIIIARRVNS